MVRSLACEALLKAGVRRLPVRIKSVAEQFGISVFTYTQYADTVDCSVAEVAQRYGADGFTQCIGGRVAVFYYQNGNLRRIRWTIAHELAHVLLGHLQDGGGADADRQADALAAELLCPSAVVAACGCTGPRELVQLCDISPAAAACRWRELAAPYTEPLPTEVALLRQMESFLREGNREEQVSEVFLPPLPRLKSHRI
ncbi:MAG: ImmA/IrrE family metallo-endopeptidase [Angelakisella sp.]